MLRNIKAWPLVASLLSDQELLPLLLTNKQIKDALCSKLVNEKNIPWEDYFQHNQEALQKYYGVRDYIIFSKIKLILKCNYKFSDISRLVRQLNAPKHLLQQNILREDNNNWQAIHRRLSQQIEQTQFQYEAESKKITEALSENCTIVVSFSTAKIKLGEHSGQYLKNSFQIAAEGGEFKKSWDYFYNRLTTETILYASAEIYDLQWFTLQSDLRPAYGSLQFYNCIRPITNYGTSFLVLAPAMRYSVTATFGDSLEMSYQGKIMPGILKHPYSLYQQFPKSLVDACRVMAETGVFPKEYDFQYKKNESQYIEVQLPPRIKIGNPKQVSHIHCNFDEHMPNVSQMMQWMKDGITVSVATNPFEDSEYAKAYQKNEIKNFLLDHAIKYLHQTMLIVGETDEKYLSCKRLENQLQFVFNITQNQPYLHQAQAWLLLKVIGLPKHQQDWPTPIKFNPKVNPFVINLNFDSYSSLLPFVNMVIKRLLDTFFVCSLNLSYFKKHQSPHPFYGKGATEESNHTYQLHLIDEPKSAYIETYWLYDNLLIEVRTDDNDLVQYVFDNLKPMFEKTIRCGRNIIINHSLAMILEKLKDRTNYLATVIIDHEEKSKGNILLALRKNPWEQYALGFSTSGGHNNNPYNLLDAYTDTEFGVIKPTVSIEQKPFSIKESFPKIAYVLLSSKDLVEKKVDTVEFMSDSLFSMAFDELGNLKPEQLKQAAAHFNLSEEEYKKHFGNALALRPVDSFLQYLKYMQNQISLLLNNESKEATLTIDLSYQEKSHDCGHIKGKFWLPSQQFGQITLTDSKEKLTKYGYYLTKYKHKFIIKNNSIIVIMNPQPFLEFVNTVIAFPMPTALEMMQYAVHCNKAFRYIKFMSFPATHLDVKSLPFSTSNLVDKRPTVPIPYDPLSKLLLEIPNQGINVTDQEGNTALHLACRSYAHIRLVEYLLAHKIDIEIRNKKNQSIWFLTLKYCKNAMAVINLLRLHEESIEKNKPAKESKAVVSARNDIMQKEVSYDHKVNFAQTLIQSYKDRSPIGLESLLQKEASTDEYQRSIVEFILPKYTQELPDFLSYHYLTLKFASGINITNVEGQTPLHICALHNYGFQAAGLLMSKANSNIRDKKGDTALHYIARKETNSEQDMTVEIRVMTLLVDIGQANLNVQNQDGNTPLHLATMKNQIHKQKLLLEAKADANIKNKAGRTPSVYCNNMTQINLFFSAMQTNSKKVQSSHHHGSPKV